MFAHSRSLSSSATIIFSRRLTNLRQFILRSLLVDASFKIICSKFKVGVFSLDRAMALRFLHRNFITKPIRTLRKFTNLAETDPVVEKPVSNVPKLTTKWNSDFKLPEEAILPIIPENNPVNHNEDHVGYFYRVSHETFGRLYVLGGYPKVFLKQRDVFADTCVMVRKPALEIISNLKNTDFSKPAVRQVIYGKYGCGKSMTLAHVLHYAANDNFLLVHVPWINKFTRNALSVQRSVFLEGALDVPHEGSTWLQNFKFQNKELISNPDFVTSRHHQWNDHESTAKGVPILELIDFGINRMLFSNMVIDILLKEIKTYSTNGLFKTLVLIDGFNGLYQDYIKDIRRIVHKGTFSLTPSFLDITKFDWCNAAIVVSVDQNAFPLDGVIVYKPYELLGKVGWNHLHPFVPIEVGNYTYAEAQNALDLYIQKKWLVNPAASTQEGRDELITLSGYNPLELMKVCDPL